jgi:methylated-DNA-[protein]-cysteine S-methyltransferase
MKSLEVTNMHTTDSQISPIMFETAWGWCGAWLGERGIVAFQLPVRQRARAEQLLRERSLLPARLRKHAGCPNPVPAFDQQAYPDKASSLPPAVKSHAVQLMRQVRRYFEGHTLAFDLALDWSQRTPFQCATWQALQQVPCGRTVTYGELAALAGRPGAARAAGHAMATNPIPLIVPCHRVIGANGAMCGFSADGGIPIKQRLLRFEAERTAKTAPKEKSIKLP